MLLILFGLPGAGKTYVGQVLRDTFGFHLHEADDDIPDDYRRLVKAGHVVSDEMRDNYHLLLLGRIAALRAEHARLAVAVPLLRQKHREWIQRRFPDAHFILVTCDPNRWEERLRARTHTVSLDYARRVQALYEPPALPHFTLDNSCSGPEDARVQLAALLARLE